MYESLPVGYATVDTDDRMYDVNPKGAALLTHKPQAHQQAALTGFFPDRDSDRFLLFCRRVVSSQATYEEEFEMKRPDGSCFFAAIQANPVKTGEGKGERVRVTFMDITRRKEAEETLRRQQIELKANHVALQELTRELFTAQEDERTRIARELHDDYCQRVTTLILEANLLKRGCEREAPSLVPRLTAMSQRLSDILNDFRTLSHELLPRNLEGPSLAVPIHNLVREFSQKAGFEITFVEQQVPGTIPLGIMTTMFRLLQESLCNIVKHASAKHVAVTLGSTEQSEVELVVADDGIGFDTARVCEGQKGIGIVGMRERARLVGGTVKIISRPGEGTTVIFSIPLPR